MQVQQDRNRLEEKSNDLAQKLTDLEQQWEDQERLMKQLKEAQSILKMSESQNQALELELAQKEALIVEIKLQFEQKAEELVEIQMDKMKIEQESNALTERFNHLKSTYEQLIAKDKSDRSTETTLEAEVFQPKSCKGCTTTTTSSSSSAQKRVVLASTSSDPNLQLAILAARLVAKTSDNDSLFRVNAELAHSNVELQNAVDMLEDKIKGMSSDSANEDGISLCSQEAEQQETEKISEKESREEPDFEAKSQKMSVSSVPKEACDPQSEKDTEKAIEKDSSIYTQQASDPIESLWTEQDSWQQSLDIKSDVNIPEKSEIVQFPSSRNSEKAAASVKSDAEEWDSNWDDSNWGMMTIFKMIRKEETQKLVLMLLSKCENQRMLTT
uniref:Uncharacterized protein n=1 Tax=Ditylenchus dipsaci TaxID=166011 RepID=A0A915CZ79_9BILA